MVCRHMSDKLGCAADEKKVAEHCSTRRIPWLRSLTHEEGTLVGRERGSLDST
jgi:hypothetical protein